MARPLRIEYEGAFYHVTCRGNERKKIYFGRSDYDKFRSYLKDAQAKYGYVLHGYVLMPNHYHLLIETPEANLSKCMHFINGSYTNYINKKRKRSGHLFQGRYKGIVLDRDEYLLELSRYIHLNPVRANVVKKPEDYLYSSFKSFISRKQDDIVYRDLILEMISRAKRDAGRRYKAFVEQGLTETLEDPLKEVYAGSILGRKSFIKEALGRLREGILEKQEISYRRQLRASHGSEEIIGFILKHYKIPRGDLSGIRGQPRKLIIYMLKKYTGITNKQIGELFGELSYSAVAKVLERFSADMEKDRLLRKQVERICNGMSNVKG